MDQHDAAVLGFDVRDELESAALLDLSLQDLRDRRSRDRRTVVELNVLLQRHLQRASIVQPPVIRGNPRRRPAVPVDREEGISREQVDKDAQRLGRVLDSDS
jgi:hypothetical protein